MKKPARVMEMYLQPGEYYFGDRDTRIRTLLGSCVAITLWHPKLLVGGMCHYLLPSRDRNNVTVLCGKYADEAIHLLFDEIKKLNTIPQEYEVKIFGGGDMFPNFKRSTWRHIGSKNAEAGHLLISRHSLQCKANDVGGVGHRTVIFDIWNGQVWVRKNQAHPALIHPIGDIWDRKHQAHPFDLHLATKDKTT